MGQDGNDHLGWDGNPIFGMGTITWDGELLRDRSRPKHCVVVMQFGWQTSCEQGLENETYHVTFWFLFLEMEAGSSNKTQRSMEEGKFH